MTRRYRLAGLNCAHCAERIEREAGKLESVTGSSVSLSTQTLTLELPEGSAESALDERVSALARDIEPNVKALCLEDEAAPAEREGEGADKRGLAIMALGAALLAVGLALEKLFGLELAGRVAQAAAYLPLSASVLKSAWNSLRGKRIDETLLMTLATLGALAIGEFAEACAVMLFYRVGEALQDMAVEKARGRIKSLMALRPDTARLVVGDSLADTPARAIAPGDEIEVRPGERVPLDGVILSGTSELDASALTGESLPVSASAGDEAKAGCVNLSGVLRVRVTKPLAESSVSRILEMTERAAERKADSERQLSRFARVYTPAVVALAAAAALIGGAVTGLWREWAYRSLLIMMLSCPCALVLSVPLTFFAGIGAGSKRGVLFKGGQPIEELAKGGAIYFDKTGTLTNGKLRALRVVPASGTCEERVIRAAALCERASAHPAAQAILALADERGIGAPTRAEAREPHGEPCDCGEHEHRGEPCDCGEHEHRGEPCDCGEHEHHSEAASEAREYAGEGATYEAEGRLYAAGNARLMARVGAEVPESAKALSVHVAEDGEYIGSIELGDDVRPEAAETLKELRTLGFSEACMLTGDGETGARRAGEALGIRWSAALTPEGKLEAVETAKARGPVVFVGDGINDAPVLAASTVGVAMGAFGREAAVEAADVVLSRDSLEGVAVAARLAKRTMRIVRQNIAFALLAKLAVMALGLMGAANMWLAVVSDVGVALICVINAVRVRA